MRIVVLHQYFLGKNEPGGSRYNQFVKYWERQGHEITVVAGTVNYTTGKKEEEYKGKFIVQENYSENVTVYRTHVSEAYNKSFIGRLWAYFSFTFSSMLAILFKIKKADVLIVTSPPLFVGITGIIAKLFKKTPMLFEVRDLWPESAIDTGVLKNKFIIKAAFIVEKLSYKFADKINVLTPAFKDVLINKKSVPDNKITMIPNGADLDIFTPGEKMNWVREKYKLHDKFIVAYVGAHGLANNLDSILNVAKQCLSNDEIVFLLVGDGMDKKRLKERAEEEKITNVLFIDSQPKRVIPDFCNAADVCTAVLQQNDTFKTVYPNKVFDYMSCARPVIIGIDGIAKELVEQSECGYYVNPDDSKAFKEMLISLLDKKEYLTELGMNGYHYVAQHFGRENISFDYISELEKIKQ